MYPVTRISQNLFFILLVRPLLYSNVVHTPAEDTIRVSGPGTRPAAGGSLMEACGKSMRRIADIATAEKAGVLITWGQP
jgi:hypothetical protein